MVCSGIYCECAYCKSKHMHFAENANEFEKSDANGLFAGLVHIFDLKLVEFCSLE